MHNTPQDLVRTNASPPVTAMDFQYYPPMAEGDWPAPQNTHFSPKRLLAFLLRYWWIPGITLVLGLAVGGTLAWLKPPTYLSTARMWETVKISLPDGDIFKEDSPNFGGTQTDLLKSTRLRELALARLRASSNSVPIPRGDDGEPLPVDIRVSQSSKSAVFLLQASGSRPAYLQAYLDALMDVYLEYKKNIRALVSGETLASITEQVQRAERDLKYEQDALTAFQRTNNLAILEEEGRISGGYLARLKTQLSDYELELRLIDSATAGAQAASGTNTSEIDLVSLSSTLSPAQNRPGDDRQSTFREIELLKLQRERLAKNLKPKHPKMVKLDADLERATRLVDIFRQQNLEQLASSRSTIQLKIDNVLSSIRDWETKVVAANTRIAEAERLKLNVQRAQSMYDRLALLVQNLSISRNIDQETLAILERASFPERTYTQQISIAGMGGFSGVAAGLGIILLIAWRDDRLESVTDVGERLTANVVGQLPDIKTLGNGASREPLLRMDDDRHAYAESYRTLRSALLFMATGNGVANGSVNGSVNRTGPADDGRPRTLLITSAVPDEGKSTISVNLARTLAQGGARVILLDGDLRKGILHHLLKLQRQPGLADALRHPENLAASIQPDPAGAFSVITTGHLTGHSGDLFLGPAFETLIKKLREQYDYIIIDSSPVFAADDAATLAPRVDGTLFVVRNRYSGARLVREALDLLYQRQARVLGLIYNRADASAGSYYYYKYADYYPAAAH